MNKTIPEIIHRRVPTTRYEADPSEGLSAERLLRMLGKDMVERLVQDDIRIQEELEAKKRKEQMPKKIGDRIQWARERSDAPAISFSGGAALYC